MWVGGRLAPRISYDAATRVGIGTRWKYHHKVAHSIIAICRVGDVAGLKSVLLGFEMEEMKRKSLDNVGDLKRRRFWPWVICSLSSVDGLCLASSPDSSTIVQPGGNRD